MHALDSAAQEFDAPTSEELARIVNEVRMGRNPEETMTETARRMDSEDFSWIAEAIQINREVGGDLSEVLDQVGDTIRERAQIKGQVRALSAEGKMSAYILIALPFGISGCPVRLEPGLSRHAVLPPTGGRDARGRRRHARHRLLLDEPHDQDQVLGGIMGIGIMGWLAIALLVLPLGFLTWGLVAVDRNQFVLIRRNLSRVGAEDAERQTRENADFAAIARRITPGTYVAKLDRLLAMAGRPAAWPLDRILILKPVLALVGAGLGLLFMGGRVATLPVLLLLFLTAFGYFLPDLLVHEHRAEAPGGHAA